RVRSDTVIDAFCEQLLVALDGLLPGGRGTVESAAVLTRSLVVKTTYLRVKRRLIELLGDDGKPFHLKTHAFRHSKAVELINNGMPTTCAGGWRTCHRR
ncbi:MAG TPA: hypothetical protein VKQ30_01290, partial [Ktedonobacterales bacterium]|nr:hypothetical protein [Ktedonobacterales bacterium]